MQNPFENGDNHEGPNGIPVPPNYATVVRKDNGEIRIGKVGLSLTAFLFNVLVPIFRGDWYNLLCMIGIQMGITLGIQSYPFASTTDFATAWSTIEFLVGLLWGFIYNMMYFRHLFNRGFTPATQRSYDLLAKRGYLPKWLKK